MTTPPPPDVSDPDPATASTPLPRSGPLGWLHLLVGLAVVGAAAWILLSLAFLTLALVPGLSDESTYVKADVFLSGLSDQRVPGLVPGVTLSLFNTVSVDSKILPWEFTLAVLARIPSLAVYLVFFVLLLRLVRTARRLDPFTALNPRRLRFVGGMLAGGSVAATFAEMIIRAQLSAALTVSGTLWDWNFPFYAVISGFGLVVVAELLRRGEMMREDLEGTI